MKGTSITKPNFEKLFREYYSRLYYFAYDFTEDIEVSKDIVSDVLLAVWNNKEHIEADKVVGYLFVSVRNQSLNYVKRNRLATDYIDFCQMIADEEGDEGLVLIDERFLQRSLSINREILWDGNSVLI